MRNIVKELRKAGVSKYSIAQRVGVTWNTVHFWEKEMFKPSEDKMNILRMIYMEKVRRQWD